MATNKEKNKEIKQKVIRNWLALDFSKDPEEAAAIWSEWNTDETNQLLQALMNRYHEMVEAEMALEQETDEDKDEDDKEKIEISSSPILRAYAKDLQSRMTRYLSSRHYEAMRTLQIEKLDEKDESIAKLAAQYFFATLPPDAPGIIETGVLTEQEKKELKRIYKKIKAFEKTHPLDKLGNISRFLLEFIDSETLVVGEKKEIIKAIVPLHVPNHHVMVNNALQNSLSSEQNPINAGPYDLKVLPKTDRRKEVTAYIIATLDQGNGLPSNLTEFERNVSDALCSIWEQARKDSVTPAFDLDSLYRAMPGGGDRATPKQKQEELAAIQKFSRLELTIDATDEMRSRNKISDTEEYRLEGTYCTFLKHTLSETRGRRRTDEAGTVKSKEVWEIRSEPLNLMYARMTGQIVTVPSKVLQIKKLDKNGNPTDQPLQMNTARRNMASNLLRRVAVILNDHKKAIDKLRHYNKRRLEDETLPERTLESFYKQKNVILFKTVFHETGNDTEDRRTQSVNKNFCFDVLDFWAAIGYLKHGYKKQVKGRSIIGVEICRGSINYVPGKSSVI